MSYSLIVSPEYQSAFLALPIWLQEETLDEIDRLVVAPAQIYPQSLKDVVFDFVRSFDGKTHYIFLTIRPDHAARFVEMISLGHFER